MLPSLTQTPNTSDRDTKPQGRKVTEAFPKVTGHSSQLRGSRVRGCADPLYLTIAWDLLGEVVTDRSALLPSDKRALSQPLDPHPAP